MKSKNKITRAAIGLVQTALCSLLLTGCVTQQLDLRDINQAQPAAGQQMTHFKESAYSVYMLLDLITVNEATVDEILAKVNPDNKPVANLRITSEADAGAVLVNLLNGGVIDRGVIVSLNKVTIEGDIIE